jgi:outer membrane protein
VLLLVAASGAAFCDELTDRAKQLLEQRRAREAYELLLPHESERAGDIEYDYLLGIAANDAGQPERAVFALERVLALEPQNHLARAEIARAYLALGEREAARREFETVRGQPIPEAAKANIERFLAAIRAAETTRVEGFIELGFGYDTNVNLATAASTIAVPAFSGPLVLDPLSRAREDAFGSLAAGVNVTHKLSDAWALVGGASGLGRFQQSENQFDQATVDANLAARWSHGKDAISLGGQLQSFQLDYARYRDITGAVAQWQHSYDEYSQVSLFGQHARLRFPTQGVRDADRDVLGVAFGRAFTVRYSPVIFASAYGGRERQLDSNFPQIGYDLWGLRAGGQIAFGKGWSFLATAAYEQRTYGAPEPVFDETRQDRQTDLSAAVSYLLRAHTTVTGQLAYTDNRSTIPISKFDRTVAVISVRFTF